MSIVLSSFLILSANTLFAESSGEDMYLRGSYLDAESYFREKDMNNPKDVRWRYNRGCAAFKSDQLDASLSAFNSVTKRTDDPEILFRASYNAGNVLFKKGDFASASQFYIQALKIKPDDEDARFNLSLALAKKKAADQQDQQKQCDNPKQGDQNQQSQDNQKSQQQNQDQKKQQKNNQDQNKDSADKKDGKEKSDKNQQPQKNADNKKEENKPDMSQDLKAAQAMPSKEDKENEPTPEEKAQKMAQMKAEALLDNIQEDQSIMIKRMQSEKEGDARSGKHW
jgi:Ca-activated chloride channel family protein